MKTQPDVAKSGLSFVAWGMFFIWVGIAMLANFPWGWFLLGSASSSWRPNVRTG
jgi:hypothetical protein